MSYPFFLRSILVSILVINALFIGYLYITRTHLDFKLEVLTNTWMVFPDFLMQYLLRPDWIGICVAVLLVCVHFLVILAGLTFTFRYGFIVLLDKVLPPKAQSLKEEDIDTTHLYSNTGDTMNVVVVKPKGAELPSKKLENLVPRWTLHIKKAPINLSRPPQNPIEKLEVAVHSLLINYKDWCVDPDGRHGSDTGLYAHSKNVAETMKANFSHRLSYLVGLSHDLGKILAYENKGSKEKSHWVRKTLYHDILSADILRVMPEFKELDEIDQKIINDILVYGHSAALPKGVQPDTVKLIRELKKADGQSTQKETKESVERLADKSEDLAEKLRDFIVLALPKLNINDYRSAGKAEGWMTPSLGALAISYPNIVNAVKGNLSDHDSRILQIGTEVMFQSGSQAKKLFAEAFEGLGLLRNCNNHRSDGDGLYDIKIGQVVFRGVYLLDIEKVKQACDLSDSHVENWGASIFPIRIKKKAAETEVSDG